MDIPKAPPLFSQQQQVQSQNLFIDPNDIARKDFSAEMQQAQVRRKMNESLVQSAYKLAEQTVGAVHDYQSRAEMLRQSQLTEGLDHQDVIRRMTTGAYDNGVPIIDPESLAGENLTIADLELILQSVPDEYDDQIINIVREDILRNARDNTGILARGTIERQLEESLAEAHTNAVIARTTKRIETLKSDNLAIINQAVEKGNEIMASKTLKIMRHQNLIGPYEYESLKNEIEQLTPINMRHNKLVELMLSKEGGVLAADALLQEMQNDDTISLAQYQEISNRFASDRQDFIQARDRQQNSQVEDLYNQFLDGKRDNTFNRATQRDFDEILSNMEDSPFALQLRKDMDNYLTSLESDVQIAYSAGEINARKAEFINALQLEYTGNTIDEGRMKDQMRERLHSGEFTITDENGTPYTLITIADINNISSEVLQYREDLSFQTLLDSAKLFANELASNYTDNTQQRASVSADIYNRFMNMYRNKTDKLPPDKQRIVADEILENRNQYLTNIMAAVFTDEGILISMGDGNDLNQIVLPRKARENLSTIRFGREIEINGSKFTITTDDGDSQRFDATDVISLRDYVSGEVSNRITSIMTGSSNPQSVIAPDDINVSSKLQPLIFYQPYRLNIQPQEYPDGYQSAVGRDGKLIFTMRPTVRGGEPVLQMYIPSINGRANAANDGFVPVIDTPWYGLINQEVVAPNPLSSTKSIMGVSVETDNIPTVDTGGRSTTIMGMPVQRR